MKFLSRFWQVFVEFYLIIYFSFNLLDRKFIFQGRFLILATNRSGSFVMETLWSIANLKQRIAIADELKNSEVQLKNDM